MERETFLTKSQDNLSVTGTIQDVLSNISHVDPVTASKIYQGIARLNSTLNTTEDLVDRDDLSTRAASDYTPTNLDCWVWMNKYGRASVYYIWQGIEYLDQVPGTPGNGPGPGNCGRVSCSYGAAIYWCNDVSLLMSCHLFSQCSYCHSTDFSFLSSTVELVREGP